MATFSEPLKRVVVPVPLVVEDVMSQIGYVPQSIFQTGG